LRGDYYPDFTAEMMHKDITLGLELGKRYGVPQPMYEFTAMKYEEAMAKYGRDSGSAIPVRAIEDAAGCRLIEGKGVADIYPGNSVDYDSHGGAFRNWSYTTELVEGSYTIVHTGYDNVYTQPPFTTYSKAFKTPEAIELERLRSRVAELEAQLAAKAQ